ncbi:MAG: class I SAM-dependent methyltransferase [Planctomycetota bacterium]|jgi:ubiquinone/menaquinone biosynthesis C-methylase UbiE
MTTQPNWQYDEMKHCGVDYSDVAMVAAYDERHRKFRDYEKEVRATADLLGLDTNQTVVDLGCGTGAFVLHGAKYCRKIHAVDVSEAMLEYCRRQAEDAGIENVEFHHAGLLTYMHSAEPTDAVVSQVALHHLPDLWKTIALKRIYDMLKPNGKFWLVDVVFDFDASDHRKFFDNWVQHAHGDMGEFAAEFETHIREEYSTHDWILKGMLERTGFKIEQSDTTQAPLATYLCTKHT